MKKIYESWVWINPGKTLLILVVLFFVYANYQGANDPKYAKATGVSEVVAKEQAIGLMRGLKASLKDPESAKFGRITIDPKGVLLCGELNAKNSFGGYTGMDTFAYAYAAGYVSGGVAYQLCYGEKASFPQIIDLTGWF